MKTLSCSSNNLSSLDISKNTQLNWLNCSSNNLSSLDISKNTQLRHLYCHSNNFSTQALDDIYCALPDRTGKENGKIQPVKNSSSPNIATVLATNKANAIAKNWKVQYYDGDTNIPATTGTYTCPQLNMSRYIALTVKSGEAIRLDLSAAVESTPVRIVSGGSTDTTITVGTGWYAGGNSSSFKVIAGASTMIIYGNVVRLDCRHNETKLTALNVSNNTELEALLCFYNNLSSLDISNNTKLRYLSCENNKFTSLDVSKNIELKELDCGNNQLSSLDLSKNTELEGLHCYNNKLSSLDISKNTKLKRLNCYNNQLSSLDISKNTKLTHLHCKDNKLTSLDLSKNTKLKTLYCHGNNFSTQALDDIYCALPDRTGKENGKILPVKNTSDPNHATIIATNAENATSKNWKVQYYADATDIPATTGIYTCPELNMSRYITLTVAKDSAIKLNFKAAAEGTPVRIVSGSNTQNITVGTDWADSVSYTAGSTTMTIYGDINGFICSGNGANLTALDLSKNTQLTELGCSSNQLTVLDVTKNTALTGLDCSSNRLTALDLSQNTLLELFFCYGNQFNTSALDDIFCSLHDRTGDTNGYIVPLKDSSDPNHTTVLATNKANATAKNWNALYSDGNTNIPATTGKHKCSATDIAEAAAEQALTLYPNPVADVLYLSATARTIRVYNIYGIEVAHATDTDRIDVANLPAGVYTVRADGTLAKMVKR